MTTALAAEHEAAPRWSDVVVACGGAFVAALSTSLVAIAAPSIAADLGVTTRDVAWVLSAYLLVISCALAAAGRAADSFGRKRMYLTGFITFAVASAACGLAPSFPLLVAARVAQGLGASALMATGPAIITRAFPPRMRARALGIQLAATYTGLTLGPTAGGLLTSRFGYVAVFFGTAAVAAMGAVITAKLLEDDAPPPDVRASSLDIGGCLLFALALSALLLALRRPTTGELATTTRGALLAASLVAFGVFVRHEARHPAPLLPVALLKTPPFAFGVVGAMLLYVVTFVLSWLLPFHLQNDRGMDAARAGALMTAQPAAMALVAPASGWLADRFGARGPSVAGMLVIALGMVLVGREAGAHDARLVISLAAVGIGAGLYVAPNNAVIMSAAPRDRQGTAAAMAATARNVGMTCGVALAVALRDELDFRSSLTVASAIAVLAAVLGALRPTRIGS